VQLQSLQHCPLRRQNGYANQEKKDREVESPVHEGISQRRDRVTDSSQKCADRKSAHPNKGQAKNRQTHESRDEVSSGTEEISDPEFIPVGGNFRPNHHKLSRNVANGKELSALSPTRHPEIVTGL